MDLSVSLLSSTIHSLCGSKSDISKHKSNYVTWCKPSNNYFIVLLINPNIMLWPMWPYVTDPGLHLCSQASHLCLSYWVSSFSFNSWHSLCWNSISLLWFAPHLLCFCLNEPFSMQQSLTTLAIICTHTFFHSLWYYLYYLLYHTFQCVNYYCLNNFPI